MIKPEYFEDVGKLLLHVAPIYKSRSWKPFMATFGWDSRVAEFMRTVNDKRCVKRISSYMIPGELERSKGSIRFGVAKEGRGYHGERGDFCMVGGSYDNGHLCVFYRRLELIGGLHYDLAIFNEIHQTKPLKRVTLFAASAMVFALKRNSNEKLYWRLRSFYEA